MEHIDQEEIANHLKTIFVDIDHDTDKWKSFESDFIGSIVLYKHEYNSWDSKEAKRFAKKEVASFNNKIQRLEDFIRFANRSLFKEKMNEDRERILVLLNQELSYLIDDRDVYIKPAHRTRNDSIKFLYQDIMLLLKLHLSIEPSSYKDGVFSECLVYAASCVDNIERSAGLDPRMYNYLVIAYSYYAREENLSLIADEPLVRFNAKAIKVLNNIKKQHKGYKVLLSEAKHNPERLPWVEKLINDDPLTDIDEIRKMPEPTDEDIINLRELLEFKE